MLRAFTSSRRRRIATASRAQLRILALEVLLGELAGGQIELCVADLAVLGLACRASRSARRGSSPAWLALWRKQRAQHEGRDEAKSTIPKTISIAGRNSASCARRGRSSRPRRAAPRSSPGAGGPPGSARRDQGAGERDQGADAQPARHRVDDDPEGRPAPAAR